MAEQQQLLKMGPRGRARRCELTLRLPVYLFCKRFSKLSRGTRAESLLPISK